jgi:hypothetical protein
MRSLVVMAVVAMLATYPVAAAKIDPEKLAPMRVRDLHYGDVLFYVYTDDDFEAITRLNAYEHWNLMPHHAAEAQLLLGGLYLSLGLHNEAGERFEKLLTQDIPAGVRNRAWFYLAQVWYARGYLERAERAIRQVQGLLPGTLDAEREHLFANVLLHEGRFDEAIQLLSGWKGSADWMDYARFNLGVALIRAGRLPAADPVLTQVGTIVTDQEELLALKDRANLALGFAYLQAQQPQQALPSLRRVRLKGPYSDKALLGAGWADATLGDYRRALTPWLELRARNLLDAAVQESYLAVPYAYGKLGANAQAVEYYENALQSFDAESARLDDAIGRIRGGKMLDGILAKEDGKHYGWFWQLERLPDAPESRYLYAVLAGHDFQEGLKNYRDLVYLGHTLDHWGDNMQAYRDMVDTRERAYGERLPRADALLATGAAEQLQRRREELEGRLNSVAAEADVAALGAPQEREEWAQIQRLEAQLAVAAPGPQSDQYKERLRLVKGVLYFRLDDAFKARVWQQHRAIKDLDLALHEAQNRWVRVQHARTSVPSNTGEFAARIAQLQARIDALQIRLVDTQHRQNDYLGELAVAQLQSQQERLAAYRVQARFELASLYDRAQDAGGAQKVPAPPPADSTPAGQPKP